MSNPFLHNPQSPGTLPRQVATDLSADLDLPVAPASCPGTVSPESKAKDRTRIHVRLSRVFLDVENILANWSAAGKCAPTIVKAIRLMDAINKGDLAAALDSCPELGLLIDRRPDRARGFSPSYKNQDSKDSRSDQEGDPDREAAIQTLIAKLKALTGDVRKAKLRATAELLHDEDQPFSVTDLDTWLERVWPEHWKRKTKGQPRPDLASIEETIGQVRDLPALLVPTAAAQSNNSRPDPYTGKTLAEETEAAAYWSERRELMRARPELDRKLTRYNWEYDMWLAEMGQLQIQLNRSTYNTWLSHLRLIDIQRPADGRIVFTAEAPHHYAQDWIERHLKESMVIALTDLLTPGTRRDEPRVALAVELVILVAGKE
jgi:hypothetical protein